LVLASASPARLAMLRAAGIDAEVMVSGVDESTVESTRPDTLSVMLARMKAEAIAGRLRQRPIAGHLLVLGCDSVLEFAGKVLGKPTDPDDATGRWQDMRGKSGRLHTGHCLIDLASGKVVDGVSATTVYFANLSDAEIAAYVATGEPLHVAGAFTIDGLGGPFIDRLEGDHGTVIGLSLPLLRALLADIGLTIDSLWRPTGPG
jgi:septum formation protein